MEEPRAKRSTRGLRMRQLVEEEEEADDDFWGQEAFAESEGDEEYSAESEAEDRVDSDFDQEEGDTDDGDHHAAPDEPEKRKRPRLVAPGSERNKKPPPPDAGPVPGARTRSAEAAAPSTPIAQRKSQRTAASLANEARKASMESGARRPATTPSHKKKRCEEERPMTQEQMLVEAARTELANLASLEQLQAIEEAGKKKAHLEKARYAGPTIRLHSTRERTVIEFKGMLSFPEPLAQPPPRPAPRSQCCVTGLPAKYKDPLTGQPYATLAAFKAIRAQLEPKEEVHPIIKLKLPKKRTTQKTPDNAGMCVAEVHGASIFPEAKATAAAHESVEATAKPLMNKFQSKSRTSVKAEHKLTHKPSAPSSQENTHNGACLFVAPQGHRAALLNSASQMPSDVTSSKPILGIPHQARLFKGSKEVLSLEIPGADWGAPQGNSQDPITIVDNHKMLSMSTEDVGDDDDTDSLLVHSSMEPTFNPLCRLVTEAAADELFH